jgi:lysophospholipase L1-like esterase
VDARLAQAGVNSLQDQAAWLKEANASPTESFPIHAESIKTQLARIVRIAKNRYPNLKIIYLSSRIYAGYASTTLNPEPYAFESGFSVKWLIEEQINGAESLNYNSGNGEVFSPWLSWGPYLWADGLVPRDDSLIWLCSNFVTDGTHPSPSGRIKVADVLLDFLKADSTAIPWFIKDVYFAGDANRDRMVNLTDLIFLTNFIFKGGYAPYPTKAGDNNCSE